MKQGEKKKVIFQDLTPVLGLLFLLVFAAPSSALSPEEKIGQMIMVGFRGFTVDDDSAVVADIEAGRIGGVILFDYDVPRRVFERNVESPEQVRRLTADLQARAAVPLFIAVDQEGGRVARLKERYGFPSSPSQGFLGDLDDPAETERVADLTARTLADAGINMNFAPVVDLNANPDNPIIGKLERSFSADPPVVIRHGKIMIESFRRAGVISALKHFPGHGSSRADSHEGFVDVTRFWSEEELVPFAVLIEEGFADMVMTAHIFNEHLDPELSATLSRSTIGGILRDRLGFDGVVVSDDLQMGAIHDIYSFEETIEKALLAGVDILLFANNSVYDEDVAKKAVEVIMTLLERGVIDLEQIDRSCERILELKQF